jgi:hypothetical protein
MPHPVCPQCRAEMEEWTGEGPILKCKPCKLEFGDDTLLLLYFFTGLEFAATHHQYAGYHSGETTCDGKELTFMGNLAAVKTQLLNTAKHEYRGR